MDRLTSAAASGLQSRMDSLDMLANNLSNSSTNGFKADREFYGTYLAPELGSESNTVGESPVIERSWTDFSQGTLVHTGSSTDLALTGTGFFSVNGPNGLLYTRNGNFHISSEGELVTSEGYPVRLTGEQTLQTQSAAPLQISSDGQISQNGVGLGQLELTAFKDSSQLSKAAAAYFSNPAAVESRAATELGAEVQQGNLETSNASPAEGAVRMISLMRNFEMLQRAVKVGTEMNRQAVEEVAKVGS